MQLTRTLRYLLPGLLAGIVGTAGFLAVFIPLFVITLPFTLLYTSICAITAFFGINAFARMSMHHRQSMYDLLQDTYSDNSPRVENIIDRIKFIVRSPIIALEFAGIFPSIFGLIAGAKLAQTTFKLVDAPFKAIGKLFAPKDNTITIEELFEEELPSLFDDNPKGNSPYTERVRSHYVIRSTVSDDDIMPPKGQPKPGFWGKLKLY